MVLWPAAITINRLTFVTHAVDRRLAQPGGAANRVDPPNLERETHLKAQAQKLEWINGSGARRVEWPTISITC